jgi:hypothetical protein
MCEFEVVYKTRGDYFNYISIYGKTGAPATLTIRDTNQIGVINGDTVYLRRWQLENDYILDINSSEKHYFTDISFKEIVAYNAKFPNMLHYPFDSIQKRIIDKDPFLEYYFDEFGNFPNLDVHIDQINEIIRNGQIELYFTRLK